MLVFDGGDAGCKVVSRNRYVKNLMDGSVELVIEGTGNDVNRMVDAVNLEM